ncbi:MAG TPA: extracellular solute-binding protein [Gemmataceae bacterium]|nr:extracellular solute-binding protein [Gemmataceae bacterium]
MSMRYAPWIAFAGSIAILIALLAVWWIPGTDEFQPVSTPEQSAVIIHTAAAMRPVVEKAAAEFKKETGISIEIRAGASEGLLTNLRVTRQGDLFLPADDSYVAEARKLGLVEQDYAVGSLTAVAVIRADYPKDVNDLSWDDIFRKGFRLAQPNSATAIGKLTKQGLEPTGLWTKIEATHPAEMGTVTEAANAVKLGSADGAVIWDATAAQYPQLKVVHLPNLDRVTASVTVAVCNNAQRRAEARKFAHYLEGDGQKHFRAAGVAPPREQPKPKARGARPGEDAEILLYAGAMLRPAIEETIKEFEDREHVTVTRVYNGCGILVSQMRTGSDHQPDLYIACDPRFMGEVADLFLKPEVVSNNQLVIAVPKGNPAGIKGLADLGKEGLKVGVGHEQQCALGAITKETFIKSGLYAKVRKNVLVESPTGDLLVNQLLTGSLDAVVCYISNVTPNDHKLDAIPITGIPCAAPEQPVAIAKGSARQELAAKLIEYLKSAESRERFEKLGFGWGSRGPKK